MSEAAASQHWQRKLLYTQAGGIARTGTDGLLAISQVSTKGFASLSRQLVVQWGVNSLPSVMPAHGAPGRSAATEVPRALCVLLCCRDRRL
jgi:hypothetical protein